MLTRPLLFALSSALLSCTSSSGSALSRLAAAHNALDATGQVRLGPVHEGSISEGATHSIALALEARCYTIAAFGSETIRAMSLAIDGPSGARSTQSTGDAAPVLRYCAAHAGAHTLRLRATQGGGSWALAAWSGASTRAPSAGSAVIGAEGTCGRPIELRLASTTAGDTREAQSALASNCGARDEDVDAPEIVYRVEVPRRMLLTARVSAAWSASVAIRRHCGEFDSELSCDARSFSAEPHAMALVDRGTYFVIVDSDSNESGEFTLELDGRDAPTAESVCRGAPELVPGTVVESSVVGQFHWVSSPCDERTAGPDRTFHLRLDQASRAQLTLEAVTPHTLTVRRTCASIGETRACARSGQVGLGRARLNEELDAGDWYITVGAASAHFAGTFRLRADVFVPGAAAGPGANCANAIALTPNGLTGANTLNANDSLRPPCAATAAAPEQVFRVDLAERSLVRLRLGGDLNRARVWWLDRCDAPSDPALCEVVRRDEQESFDRVLDRGTHFLAVEAAGSPTFGEVFITSTIDAAAPIERACAAASPLPVNAHVRGVLLGRDAMRSSCAPESEAPERVYRLELQRRSSVSITVRSTAGSNADGDPAFAPALSVRRACALPSSETHCSLPESSRATLIDTFDPGVYFVIVDGRLEPGHRATYVLETTVSPP